MTIADRIQSHHGYQAPALLAGPNTAKEGDHEDSSRDCSKDDDRKLECIPLMIEENICKRIRQT